MATISPFKRLILKRALQNPALLSKIVSYLGFKCFGAVEANTLSLVSKSWHRASSVCYNGIVSSLSSEVQNFFNINSILSSRELSSEQTGTLGYCAPFATYQVFALEEP